MKILKIDSRLYGTKGVLLDDEDFERVKRLGGKWTIVNRAERSGFYIQKRMNRRVVLLPRFVMNVTGKEIVDHINRNTLDNRKCNLRICSNSANIRNGKVRTNNTSGITGVRLSTYTKIPKWEAYIKVKFKKIHLGYYLSKDLAIQARKCAELKYFSV